MSQLENNKLRTHNISQQYKIIQKVGRGTYGTVYKAKHLKSGAFVAIKKIQNKDEKMQSEGFPITALREINLLKIMNHKNIIQLKQIVVSKPQKKNLFRGSTFLIFQYMEHDFAGLFRNRIKFTLPQIKCLMLQILEGVKYLHNAKILHRDIKSANLLLNSKGEVKIADFGLARKFRFDFLYTSKVVTLWYRAPELLLGTKIYSEKIDVWSVGCILAEFLIGDVLFKKQTQYSQIEKIYDILGGLQENNFQEAKNYTHYNDFKPKKPYPKQLNEFIRKYNQDVDMLTLQFLTGLLELNPRNRLSAEAALNHRFFVQSPLPCKPIEIPKLNVQYHQMFKQKKPQEKAISEEEQQYKPPPAKYFQNERKYSYKKDYDKNQYQNQSKSNKYAKDYHDRSKQHSRDYNYQFKKYDNYSKGHHNRDRSDRYDAMNNDKYNKMQSRQYNNSNSRINNNNNSRDDRQYKIRKQKYQKYDSDYNNSKYKYSKMDSSNNRKYGSRVNDYDYNQQQQMDRQRSRQYEKYRYRQKTTNNINNNNEDQKKYKDSNITIVNKKDYKKEGENYQRRSRSHSHSRSRSRSRSKPRSNFKSNSRSRTHSYYKSSSKSRSGSRQNQTFTYSWKNPIRK